MHAKEKEHASMRELSSNSEALRAQLPEIAADPVAGQSASSASRVQIPTPFADDWHPQFGSRLAVFPRNLFYTVSRGEKEAGTIYYWPDLATFVEDELTIQMMYYRSTRSAYSLQVIFHKTSQGWTTLKYRDYTLTRWSQGETFTSAMQNAIAWGVEPEEELSY